MNGNGLLNCLHRNNQVAIRTGANKSTFDSRKHASEDSDTIANPGDRTRSRWNLVRQDGLDTLDFRIGNCLRASVVSDEPDDSGLELVRMLSNFETTQEKLIQIVLSGQPQLAHKLASPELVQLRQRISILGCLKPFSPEETALYIEHRLQVAGYRVGTPLFSRGALAMIAEHSEGVPRNINNLCFNAMSLGCAFKRTTIDREIVREIIADLDLEPLQERIALAWRPEEDGAQGVPAFASIMNAPSMRMGWLPKFIAACAILLVLGGALFQGHRWMRAKTVVHANRVLPPTIPARSSFLGLQQNPQRATQIDVIRVAAGQSLYRICIENFGCYNSERVQEIQKLNPWLSNLDHIESGQKLRIPVVEELSSPTQRDIAQSGNALLAKRGRQ